MKINNNKIVCLDCIVVNVMNSHSCDRGFNAGQGNDICIML